MEGFDKSKNITHDLYRPVTWRTVKATQKNEVWCKIAPLRANFQNSSIKVQQTDVLAGLSCPSVPLQRNASSLYPLQKTPTLFTAILRHFGPGHQNFSTRLEFGLHTPVKFYTDPLRFAGVTCEKPILSKYILHWHAFSWQRIIRYFTGSWT